MHHHSRLKFLGGRPRTAFASGPASEPAIAPAALYGDDGRGPYLPGPILAYSAERGVILFRDAPDRAWPPARPAPRRRRTDLKHVPLWIFALQMALVLGSLAWGAMVTGPGQ